MISKNRHLEINAAGEEVESKTRWNYLAFKDADIKK